MKPKRNRPQGPDDLVTEKRTRCHTQGMVPGTYTGTLRTSPTDVTPTLQSKKKQEEYRDVCWTTGWANAMAPRLTDMQATAFRLSCPSVRAFPCGLTAGGGQRDGGPASLAPVTTSGAEEPRVSPSREPGRRPEAQQQAPPSHLRSEARGQRPEAGPTGSAGSGGRAGGAGPEGHGRGWTKLTGFDPWREDTRVHQGVP